ncbi:hypothetical protein PBAL39_25430 [Pedobacter sp. BAL39]|nr:hypothetical protein PBAL39_25430 [Pedobacter sp. BAL39]
MFLYLGTVLWIGSFFSMINEQFAGSSVIRTAGRAVMT